VYLYKISVVIVNYNVEYFLKQCLRSVYKALQHVEGEVFVVDNNSKDGSVAMVQESFPECTLVVNSQNVGFSRANNQAIAQARGEYILLLNPDTVIGEDTLRKVVDFMDSHPQAGSLGVKMVDGKGRFAPESKRGLPNPIVAFYKILGLSRLFPSSKRFGRYHLGYLSNSEVHSVDVLSGAFMLIREKALKKTGTLDETFFMYGEDIDLSYRITQAGYKNYYYPHTKIIHYKGESTKKSSVNYIRIFYQAMIIFANKHFASKNARLFSSLILSAIYFRAFLAIMVRIGKRFIPPIIDMIIIVCGMHALAYRWTESLHFFSYSFFMVILSLYASLWIVSLCFFSSYKLPLKIYSLARGLLSGSAILILINFFLPNDYSFPIKFILYSTVFIFIYFIISRLFIHFFLGNSSPIFPIYTKRYALVGGQSETELIKKFLKRRDSTKKNIFLIDSNNQQNTWSNETLSNLPQLIRKHKIQEVVFCAKDMEYKTIIENMIHLSETPANFKIAPPNASYCIGSDSIEYLHALKKTLYK